MNHSNTVNNTEINRGLAHNHVTRPLIQQEAAGGIPSLTDNVFPYCLRRPQTEHHLEEDLLHYSGVPYAGSISNRHFYFLTEAQIHKSAYIHTHTYIYARVHTHTNADTCTIACIEHNINHLPVNTQVNQSERNSNLPQSVIAATGPNPDDPDQIRN